MEARNCDQWVISYGDVHITSHNSSKLTENRKQTTPGIFRFISRYKGGL